MSISSSAPMTTVRRKTDLLRVLGAGRSADRRALGLTAGEISADRRHGAGADLGEVAAGRRELVPRHDRSSRPSSSTRQHMAEARGASVKHVVITARCPTPMRTR